MLLFAQFFEVESIYSFEDKFANCFLNISLSLSLFLSMINNVSNILYKLKLIFRTIPSTDFSKCKIEYVYFLTFYINYMNFLIHLCSDNTFTSLNLNSDIIELRPSRAGAHQRVYHY